MISKLPLIQLILPYKISCISASLEIPLLLLIGSSIAASVEQSSIKCLCELGTTFHLSSQLLGIICLHKSHTILQKKLNPVLRKKNKMKGLIFNSFLSTLKMLKPIIKFTICLSSLYEKFH